MCNKSENRQQKYQILSDKINDLENSRSNENLLLPMSMHTDYSSSTSIIQCNKNPKNLIQIRKEFKIIKKQLRQEIYMGQIWKYLKHTMVIVRLVCVLRVILNL